MATQKDSKEFTKPKLGAASVMGFLGFFGLLVIDATLIGEGDFSLPIILYLFFIGVFAASVVPADKLLAAVLTFFTKVRFEVKGDEQSADKE